MRALDSECQADTVNPMSEKRPSNFEKNYPGVTEHNLDQFVLKRTETSVHLSVKSPVFVYLPLDDEVFVDAETGLIKKEVEHVDSKKRRYVNITHGKYARCKKKVIHGIRQYVTTHAEPEAAREAPPASGLKENIQSTVEVAAALSALSAALEKICKEDVCVTCSDGGERTHAFRECGHYCCCESCASTAVLCPMCKTPITQGPLRILKSLKGGVNT